MEGVVISKHDEKMPWETEGSPWKTSSSYFSWLRGGLRRVWNKHPHKLNLIKKHRRQIPNPNPKGNRPTVWGGDCSMCGGEFVERLLQVDHIEPAGSLTKVEDIQGFVERLLVVTEDSLRVVCVECNTALSLSERLGITYEEALVERKVIEVSKLKADKQREWLIERGVEPASNGKLRREQIKKVIEGGK